VGKGKRRDAVLRLVGGLEAGSSHPYALAVQDLLAAEGVTPAAVTNLRDVNAGVVGRYRGDDVVFTAPTRCPTAWCWTTAWPRAFVKRPHPAMA